jgi:hypothetical protein
MIPFISAVGEAIASKPTLNTNCGEPTIGTPTEEQKKQFV